MVCENTVHIFRYITILDKKETKDLNLSAQYGSLTEAIAIFSGVSFSGMPEVLKVGVSYYSVP